MAGVTYSLIEATERGWSSTIVVSLVVGVVGLVSFVTAERHSRHPMLPLRIFASRRFRAVNAVTFIVYGVLGTTFFLLVVQFQMGVALLKGSLRGSEQASTR
ncbi:MAG: hypothetical protein ACR2G7_01140 [Acidimicrobiales bacterium]